MVAEGEIGTGGGTLTVTSGPYAGTSIEIPANAVAADVRFGILADTADSSVGLVAVGLAARFTPDDATISPPATVTLLYDPTSLPPQTSGSELTVTARLANGTRSQITPMAVDTTAGLVTISSAQLATFWVVAPDRFLAADYFPLEEGNQYVFDVLADNLVVVADATSDPGLLGMADWRLTFFLPWFHRAALYLEETAGGGIDYIGLLDSPPQMLATLELRDAPVPFLNPVETVGGSHSTMYDYTVFSIDLNNLPPTQIGTGTGMLTVDIVGRENVTTPVGIFTDTVVVSWTESYDDSTGASGEQTSTMWLASGVGPVQIQADSGDPVPIRSATVGGQPVTGR